MVRRANAELINQSVKSFCRKKKSTIADVAKELEVSKSMLEQLMSGRYKAEVKEMTQLRICKFFGVSRKRLFPVVGATEKVAS